MHDLPAARRFARRRPRAPFAGRWARAPRVQDALTALSCLALMSLDIPGLAEADNSLNGPLAALVLTLGAASLLLRRPRPG